MKKILFILTLSTLLSCNNKRYLLESSNIPSAIEIPDKPDEINHKYVRVELDNQVVDTDKVFGGFRKRFKFKGSWYILADHMYKYHASSKLFSMDTKNIILKIDDEKNVSVYAKNIPFDKYGEDIVSSNSHDKHVDNAWFNLNKENLVITDSEIFHEDYWYDYHRFDLNLATNEGSLEYEEEYSYQESGEHGPTTKYGTNIIIKNYAYVYPVSLSVYSTSRGKTYTTDLINWLSWSGRYWNRYL